MTMVVNVSIKKAIAPLDLRIFYSRELKQNPFPVYQQLRDSHPIHHNRFHNKWIISRYQDLERCFQDNGGFDRAMYTTDWPYQFGINHVFGPNILEYGNSGEHRRLRNIVAGQLVGQEVE